MPLKVLDLCSGIGGFRVGFELSNVPNNDIQFNSYSDIDPYANKAYEVLFDTRNEICLENIQKHTRFENELDHQGPLAKTKKRESLINKEIPDIDFLFAGFPCQPHSLMGNRKGNNDARGNLFYDIAEILRVKKPEYFVLENVRSLVSVNEGKFYEEIMNTLSKKLKYNVTSVILNASDFGVTQTRRRIFIVGSKSKDLSDFCIEKYKKECNDQYPTTWHLLERKVNDKYYLSDKILKTILKDQHKGYRRKAEINKLIARPITKTMHKMHRASQDNYFSDSFLKGKFDKETNKVTPSKVKNDRIRRITPREALRIQSFPEHYIDKLVNSDLSDTRLYMLAGNSVPPKMVSAVINALFD